MIHVVDLSSQQENDMSNTIKLDLPDPAIRARHNVIRSILEDLIAHEMTMDEAVKAIDHMTIAMQEVQKLREFNGGDTPPIP